MTTSGTSTFGLTGADLVFEAFERLQIAPAGLTAQHMLSARRSMNLVQSRWANRGTNLWKVDPAGSPQTLTLSQGVATYALAAGTIMALDVYLRTFAMGSAVNFTPGLATTNGSSTVTVNLANHQLAPGMFVNFVIPMAIGGIIVFGFYPVAAVPDGSHFTIVASQSATATVANGGTVPVFTTTQGSAFVSVNLPAHGLQPAQSFAVQVATAVGGITLNGLYTVTSVTDANNFVIQVPSAAASNASASENGGLSQIAKQQLGVDPIDRPLTPFSRADYAALPDKSQQSTPTTYYFDRQSAQPMLTLWQVPDGNGPYQVQAYTVRQLQDLDPYLTETPDIPYRFSEALCADLAAHLAKKYPPPVDSGITLASLKEDAAEAWAEAAAEDRERVSTFIVPDLSGYFR